jgi:hypothetical protein
MNQAIHRPSKTVVLASLILGLTASVSPAALLFSDNFNVANTTNFDTSDTTGRNSGLLASDIILRSGGVVHAIANNQLNFKNPTNDGTGSGRIRIQTAFASPASLFDFASGVSGTQILADGGFRVEFDWTPPSNTAPEFIALTVGNTTFDSGFQVANAGTDYGLLLRHNGNVQVFDSGTVIQTPTFSVPTVTTHHASIDFFLTSFADGATVTAKPSIDGVQLGSPVNFTWAGNSGVINLELENNSTPTLTLDNLSISTVPEPTSLALLGCVGLIAAGSRRSRRA